MSNKSNELLELLEDAGFESAVVEFSDKQWKFHNGDEQWTLLGKNFREAKKSIAELPNPNAEPEVPPIEEGVTPETRPDVYEETKKPTPETHPWLFDEFGNPK